MKTWKIFSLLALPLIAGLTSSCSKDENDSTEEGDYSYLQAGLVTETQPDGTTMYFVPVEGASTMAVTWERNGLTYARLCQMLGGSAGEKYDATNQVGVNTYSGEVTVPAATADGTPVTAVGKWAFTGCINVTKITLPESITTIEDEAATYCTNLAEINLPDGITYIGDGALAYNKLTSITIPAGIKVINRFAFAYTSALQTLTFNGHETDIEACAFTQFNKTGNKVTTLTFPSTLQTIGVQAFRYFTKLTKLDLSGTQVKTISDYAFGGCSSLTEILLPACCDSIGEGALALKSKAKLYVKNPTPPHVNSALSLSNASAIYVPTGSLDAYKADAYWSKYATKITEE